MASRSEHRSRRRWLLADGGYVLVEGARTLGGPYPEVALVYGPEPKASAAAGPGRPRTKSRAHEPLQAAITQMARVATTAATLGWSYLSCKSVRSGSKSRYATRTYELGLSAHELYS